VRGIQRGVDDGEIPHLADETESAQPGFVFLGEMLAGPVDGFLGEGVEIFEDGLGGGLLVVIAHYHGAIELADDLDALVGVCIVTDDIAQADVMGTVPGFRVGEDSAERFEICMNVSEDGETHLG
jgi:hypothetical protein